MIGNLILLKCINNNNIKNVTCISRKPLLIKHPKIIEVIHNDFLDFNLISHYLQNQDICFYCLGVYTGQVSKEEFYKITVNYTEEFAKALIENSNCTTFCFLSGQGADSKEKSKIMFARDKGIAENKLLKLSFYRTYIFRPGYIYPIVKRIEPNFNYKIFRIGYKYIMKFIYPNIGVTSEKLADVMLDVGLNLGNKTIYENKDIRLFRI